MATFILDVEELSVVVRHARIRVQKIDYDLGDCNNEVTRAAMLGERAILIRALGELSAAEYVD